jgi:two-component system nitrogen regulation response regulator GlnG
MTPLTQTKVLRALQDQQFERVGGNQTIHTNVRLIAATNRNLETMIAAGQFRSDLYYRLNVYTIHLPPLRERSDDIALLVKHFIRRFRRELDKDVTDISDEGLDTLRAYPWPGNIRELQSVLKHAMLQATGPVLVPAFFPVAIRMAAKGAEVSLPIVATPSGTLSDILSVTRERLSAGSTNLFEEVIGLAERQLFVEVLKHTEGNLSHAARILGINRATLRTKLAAYGLTAE